MSATSWMIRNRNLRSTKSRRIKENDPDYVKLDLSKDPRENATEILHNICQSSTLTDVKLLNYLNNYVKFISNINFKYSQLGYNSYELLSCIRLACVHESTLIRTAGLRALRYTVKTEEHVEQFNTLVIPFLVARSFDIAVVNDVERVQALKLIRRLLLISPKHFDISLGRSLVALANGPHEEKDKEKDRMLRACLAALSELGVLNSKLFIKIGGCTAIIRNLLECQTPQIAESLCGTLLHLMNHPDTRQLAAIDLKCLAAPYCDFHYRRTSSANTSEMAEERELRFNCSRLALLSVLRSWPGILHFCNPMNPTSLKAMVEILYLEHLEVKNAVLDLLYELLNLPQPEWTDEFSVALNAVDPADGQDSWRLRDGFVAAEARSLLPHLARTTPNLAEIHLSILLYAFIEVGLLTALAQVIVTGDTFICVRATILLGVLLHWTHQLLPPDCCNITPSLPNLVMDATNKPQALSAVAALQDLHTMLKQRPASSSLFLDHILMSSNHFKSNPLNSNVLIKKRERTTSTSARSKLYQLVSKDNNTLLRDSAVLENKDGYTWDWDIIRTILKDNADIMQKIDESSYKAFLKRLVQYFKPSSNRFSHMDLSSSKQAQKYTLAGCDLIHFLLNTNEPEGLKLLNELFRDISIQIEAITTSKSAHDCLFSPQHMSNTCCQMYFLFIGHLTHSHNGLDILTKTGVFEQLLKLATTSNHDCYVKLIISSLDYSRDAYPRLILSKTLTSVVKGSRLYATQFLLVLMRAKVYEFERWGIEMLVNQLYDQSKAISFTALNILQEACEEKVHLERLVQLKPDLVHLGDKGLLLLIRFLSTSNGFAFLQQNNFITNEINRWITNFNYRYVRIVEEELHDSLTLHQRNEYGHYNRRSSSVKTVFRKDIFIPPHLYGQLVQYTKGFNILLELGNLSNMFKCLEAAVCETESDMLELKAALWACGHVATSSLGVDLLATNNVFQSIVNIAKSCPVYSMRGTAIYVLGIMSTTYKGANELFKLGWACTRHDRHDQWPVIEGENWEVDSVSPHGFWNGCWWRSEKESESSDRISDNSSLQYWSEDPNAKHTGEFCLPEADDSVTDDEIIFSIDNDIHKKSQTLPYGSLNTNHQKHQRSLSESKTIEVMSDKSDKIHKVLHRHRDSESSTSGVSSCDSVVGKFNISERIQTLSPIPSSSSLSTLKPYLSYQQQRSRSEFCRQLTDLVTISPTDSTRLSHQDLLGYSTWRILRHQNKPFYLDTSDDELSTIVSGGGSDKIKFPIYKSLKERALVDTQLSLTDLESNNLPNPILTGGSLSSQTSIVKRTSLLRNMDRNDGPCYLGVCLPRKLLDIFPAEKNQQLSTIDNINNDVTFTLSESNNQITNNSLHNIKLCLICCCRNNSTLNDQPSLIKIFSSVSLDSPSTSVSDSSESRLKIEILRHVERLSNPIWYKQSRQALLHLKQKHSHLFQDICLYSETCLILSNVSMRLTARRFLQELFQDLNYDVLFRQPMRMVLDRTGIQLSTTSDISTTAQSPPNEQDDIQVRCYQSDSMQQRISELSTLMQTPSADASSFVHNNKIVVVSTNNNTPITRGFKIVNNSNECDYGPVRSPPLASVKEETLSSIENLLSLERNKTIKLPKDNNCSDNDDDEKSEMSDKLLSPRGQKTLMDSLHLTYSQNKFPITTRYQDTTKDITSYRSSASTINNLQTVYKNCVSTTKCVPNTVPANVSTQSKE